MLTADVVPTVWTEAAEVCLECGHDHQSHPMFAALLQRLGRTPTTACSERYELDGMAISDEDCGCKNPFHTLG